MLTIRYVNKKELQIVDATVIHGSSIGLTSQEKNGQPNAWRWAVTAK